MRRSRVVALTNSTINVLCSHDVTEAQGLEQRPMQMPPPSRQVDGTPCRFQLAPTIPHTARIIASAMVRRRHGINCADTGSVQITPLQAPPQRAQT
jgi:hypothetical protein